MVPPGVRESTVADLRTYFVEAHFRATMIDLQILALNFTADGHNKRSDESGRADLLAPGILHKLGALKDAAWNAEAARQVPQNAAASFAV